MSLRRSIFVLALIVGVLVTPASFAQDDASEPRFSVLAFSKTEGFRHASIPEGKEALLALGTEHDIQVDTTERADRFTDDGLASYDAVVFLNTTGDVLDEAQQEAFERYIRGGGGYVGIHAAADTEYDWSWYGELVGAYFESHPDNPNVRDATVIVSDRVHPATRHLPVRWERTDEWYDYRVNPRGDVHVLATLDASTYEGGTMGHDHPIAWAHEYEGGRAFYTGGGHTAESYAEPHFREHLLGGIEWAAGHAEGEVGATLDGSFEKVVLDSTTTDPIELSVAPDGRVFYIERRGIIKIWHPDTETTTLAGYVPVTIAQEDGMMGLTLDPNFADNGWIYLYYSPPEGEPRNQLSRFTVEGDRVDLDSEVKILEVPTQREECCHTGGSLAFGPDGTLFLSTGDDTNPFDSDGFAPIDERPDREPWDAQRSSANTQDLRGKILRIRPHADGSYTIPDGNLFDDPEEGRPEIYVMGNRNPYRISVDHETGWLYWGDVGPDAGAPDSTRGPAGHDEFNQAREAGNYGWPYFIGDNKAYVDYDFEMETSGAPFDPEAPVNDSPNNTGSRSLPAPQPAMIWYPYDTSEEFPEMEAGGRTAMAGPVYHYDDEAVGPHGLPSYFDGSLFIYEWARHWIKEIKFDADGHPAAINPILSDKTFIRPMDMELGPDGRLYLIEWGNDFNGGPNSKVVRLDYYGSEARPPVAAATATPSSGPLPLDVTFQADTTHVHGPDEALSYAWDVDGNGTPDAYGAQYTHTFETAGTHTVHLTVTDSAGRSATDEITVTAGNTRPAVTIDWPVEGGVVPIDTPIAYQVTATDPEDASIAEDRVLAQPYLGRDSHLWPLQEQSGTTGTFRITYGDDDYEPKTDLVAAFEARYTDGGAPDAEALEDRAKVTLQPQRKEAEHATSTEDVEQETLDAEAEADSRDVLTVEHGSHAAYAPVNLLNIDAITFHVAPMAGGRIEVRQDAPDGSLLAEAKVDSTTFEEETSDIGTTSEHWTDVTVPITDSDGPHTLYLVFHGTDDEPLMKLDWIRFEGDGMMQRPDRSR